MILVLTIVLIISMSYYFRFYALYDFYNLWTYYIKTTLYLLRISLLTLLLLSLHLDILILQMAKRMQFAYWHYGYKNKISSMVYFSYGFSFISITSKDLLIRFVYFLNLILQFPLYPTFMTIIDYFLFVHD